MGAEATFNVDFNLSGITSYSFDMYLPMGYGSSAKKAQRLTQPISIPNSTGKQHGRFRLYHPRKPIRQPWVIPGMITTQLHHTLWQSKSRDWEHGVTTVANPPWIPAILRFGIHVANVSVEVPGMNSTLQFFNDSPEVELEPRPDPLIYNVSFPLNQNHLGDGEYIGLVKVSDSRIPDGSLSPPAKPII